MSQRADYRLPLSRSLVALAIGTMVVVICYFWIDRPVAFFVERYQLPTLPVFKWFTYPPPLAQSWSPAVLVLLMVRRAWRPFTYWERTLLVACLSLLVANEFRTSLGDLCGRYWPATWFDDNPSLLGTGTYGFHPFVHGDDVGSFPSGHAARIVGFFSVWWIAMPRGRALWVIVSAPMLVSLVAMNYHFVGDVVAGSVLGGIIGAYAAALAGLAARGRNATMAFLPVARFAASCSRLTK